MGILLGIALGFQILAQPPVNSRPFRLDELKTPPGFEAPVYAGTNAGIRADGLRSERRLR